MANVAHENDRLEYKSLRINNRDMLVDEVLKMFKKGSDSKQKELNAMLNYGGGEVHFGIGEIKQSDGTKTCVVEEGIKLSDEEKEKINDAIHLTFTEFNPSCSSDRGDYKIEWKTETDKSDKRHRFTVIINRCSAYNRGHIVFMNGPHIVAYTRSGSFSVPMTPERIKKNLQQTALIEAGDSVRWTQASIDANLIQRLRDALDKYEDKIIGAADITCILKQYEREIDRQKYQSYVLVEEVLNVMNRLAWKLRFQQTEIEIADEIVNLGDCIYYAYVHSLPHSWNDSELCTEAENHRILKNPGKNATIQLFEVCFSVAHDSVKYRSEDNMFAKATAVLAKILNSASIAKDHNWFKRLHQRYEELHSSIQQSQLDVPLQKRLLKLHQLLPQLCDETDPDKKFHIEKKILNLGYKWY
jgi:hypothetical protein